MACCSPELCFALHLSQIIHDLTVHSLAEEEVLYPEMKNHMGTEVGLCIAGLLAVVASAMLTMVSLLRLACPPRCRSCTPLSVYLYRSLYPVWGENIS